MAPKDVTLSRVFGADNAVGGNPCPVVLDAHGWTDEQMQSVAKQYGHESAFIVSATEASGADFEFRFWVPRQEVEMCGHATLASMWLLARNGRVQPGKVRILTKSGLVLGQIARQKDSPQDFRVELLQSPAEIKVVPEAHEETIFRVLGITRDGLADIPLQNASTARFKTLVPLASKEILNSLQPDYSNVEPLCFELESTGLYPYALDKTDSHHVHARQFPRSSGYPEDSATGIAAAALAFALLDHGLWKAGGQSYTVSQGYAMGKPSTIGIRFEVNHHAVVVGCWLSGQVEIMETNE